MGAAMLRAKAHADGFAMTPPDAASMTSELLAMLGTPEGSGELGPHLAQIAAAVATAGGAETLASLVNASISLAAPDSNGVGARSDPNALARADQTRTPPSPSSPRAPKRRSIASRRTLRRRRPPRRTYSTTSRGRCRRWRAAAATRGGGGVGDDAARADVFRALRLWICGGHGERTRRTKRALRTFGRRGDRAQLWTRASRFGGGDAAGAVRRSDPLPGRAAAVDAVLERSSRKRTRAIYGGDATGLEPLSRRGGRRRRRRARADSRARVVRRERVRGARRDGTPRARHARPR